MIEEQKSPKVVYLDQNKWIDLARSHYEVNNESRFKNLLAQLQKLCREGKLILPLSVVHLTETQKESRIERRKRLAILMAELSQGYTILFQEKVLDLEISNYVASKCNETPKNICKEILGKGFGFALGIGTPVPMLPQSAFKSSLKEKQFYNDLKNHFESEKLIYKFLINSNPKLTESLERLRRDEVESIQKVETARKNAQRDLTKEQRYYVELIDLTDQKFIEKVQSRALEKKIDIFELLPVGNLTKNEIDVFYENFPTMLITVMLYWRRNEETQRRHKPNDGRDLHFLSVVIPYCDIVVTEKDWCSKAKSLKLDKKYNTQIFSNLNQLETWITENS